MKRPEAISSPLFSLLGAVADELGLKAFVIGGFVRDYFLNKTCKDVDIVVEGHGIDLAKAFAKKIGIHDVVVYENFRTAMVQYEDFVVEFVGARKESYRSNSRKPIVEEGTLEDDQIRRDFTINALSISINKASWGEVIDPFDGLVDLENGFIRTPTDPNITFSDDPLRMMRGIRFASQLGFRIEEKTWKGISDNKDRIKIVSQERITDEVNKIVLSPKPSVGFKMLFSSGLLEIIFPEMHRLQGVDYVNGRGHKDNFYHTLQVLDNLCEESDDLWLRWAAILHDIAKPPTKRYDEKVGWTFHGHEDRGARMVPKLFARMKLPLDGKMKFVQEMVKLHLRPIALVDDEVTDSALRRLIVDAGDYLDELLTLCRADITTRDEGKQVRYRQNFIKVEKKIKDVEERDQLRNWQPPVTGEMIMEHFHIPPSRMVGNIKNAIREAILDGDIPNEKEAAFQLMIQIGKRMLAEE